MYMPTKFQRIREEFKVPKKLTDHQANGWLIKHVHKSIKDEIGKDSDLDRLKRLRKLLNYLIRMRQPKASKGAAKNKKPPAGRNVEGPKITGSSTPIPLDAANVSYRL